MNRSTRAVLPFIEKSFLFSTGNLNLGQTNVSFSSSPSYLFSSFTPFFFFPQHFPSFLPYCVQSSILPSSLSPFTSPRHSFLPDTTLLHYLTDWLTDRQTDWLTDSLSDSLIYMVIPYNVKTNKQSKQISYSSNLTLPYPDLRNIIKSVVFSFPLRSSPMIRCFYLLFLFVINFESSLSPTKTIHFTD